MKNCHLLGHGTVMPPAELHIHVADLCGKLDQCPVVTCHLVSTCLLKQKKQLRTCSCFMCWVSSLSAEYRFAIFQNRFVMFLHSRLRAASCGFLCKTQWRKIECEAFLECYSPDLAWGLPSLSGSIVLWAGVNIATCKLGIPSASLLQPARSLDFHLIIHANINYPIG